MFFFQKANICHHITEDTISMTHQWQLSAIELTVFVYSSSLLRIKIDLKVKLDLRALNKVSEMVPRPHKNLELTA